MFRLQNVSQRWRAAWMRRPVVVGSIDIMGGSESAQHALIQILVEGFLTIAVVMGLLWGIVTFVRRSKSR